jgi:hypothetical protein
MNVVKLEKLRLRVGSIRASVRTGLSRHNRIEDGRFRFFGVQPLSFIEVDLLFTRTEEASIEVKIMMIYTPNRVPVRTFMEVAILGSNATLM